MGNNNDDNYVENTIIISLTILIMEAFQKK